MERKAEVNFLKVDIDPILAKKRHLIITGSRRSGKSTLLREILTLPDFPADTISSEISESLRNPVSADSSLPGSCLPVFHGLGRHISDIPFLPGQAESRLQMFPGFTTHAFKQDRVELTDNLTGETSRIGIYRPKFSFHAFPADSDSGKSAASSASSAICGDGSGSQRFFSAAVLLPKRRSTLPPLSPSSTNSATLKAPARNSVMPFSTCSIQSG